MGTVGTSNYNNFNGQINQVRLNLGNDAFIDSKADLNSYVNSNFPKPPYPEHQEKSIQIIDEIVTKPKKDVMEYAEEFKDSQQYGVHMWFRSLELK